MIISFSLNAIPVAKRWEKAPPVLKRIEAARKAYKAGYEVRIRIDPMVPIDTWKESYLQLVDLIFDGLLPERITLGSLRGLQSTINGCSDKSWVKYLTESSNWGKKINFDTRFNMYSEIIGYLKSKYNYEKVALCKETIEIWNSLKMNYRQIRCNCIFRRKLRKERDAEQQCHIIGKGDKSLNQEILERLRKISERLKKEYHAEKVILYGSHARGEATEDSDVDLFIIASTKERFFQRMATVRGLIRDLRNGLPVSPIVLTPKEVEKRVKIGDQFIIEIIEKGLYL